jgi:hypothetical protein
MRAQAGNALAINFDAMGSEEAQRVEEKTQAGAMFSSGKISE